jgi:hypothetical protein
MNRWHVRWRIVAIAGLVVVLGAVVSVAYAGDRAAQLPERATPTPRDLGTTLSVHVISRVDETPCVAGASGVPGPAGHCYQLESGLDFTRAAVVELAREQSGACYVLVTLEPADRDRFAAWTVKAAGRQIAVSVPGRVLSAPHLETALSGDAVHISLGEAEARTVVEQLWP